MLWCLLRRDTVLHCKYFRRTCCLHLSRIISTDDREDILRVEVYHENEASTFKSSFTPKMWTPHERMKFTLKMDVERSGYKSVLEMKRVCQGLKSTLEMGKRFKIKVYSENTLCFKNSSLNEDNSSGLKNTLKMETASSELKYTLKIGTVIQNWIVLWKWKQLIENWNYAENECNRSKIEVYPEDGGSTLRI